jgi:hypothetical protein
LESILCSIKIILAMLDWIRLYKVTWQLFILVCTNIVMD